jgi:hypothetical protein
MKLDIQRASIFASLAMLGSAMLYWADLFLFSKTVQLPEWTKFLPSPIDAPMYITFVCLIPVFLFSKTLSTAAASASKVILLAPILVLITYAFRTNNVEHLLFNVGFNYLWVIGFNCLLPVLVLLGIRAIGDFLIKHFKRRAQ